jgi:hypothetical protein
VAQALERIRKVARERKKERFTALFHHISTELPYCFNTKLGGIADFKVGFWWEARGDWPMPNKRSDDDIIRDPEKWLLREQAKVMLDLFAEDCGRTPATRKPDRLRRSAATPTYDSRLTVSRYFRIRAFEEHDVELLRC